MTYKQISEKTFGSTPAAMYLVRELNTLKDPVMLRNSGKRITATTKQVSELCYAYEHGFISPKTLANTLRLMREEVANDFCYKVDTFVDRLRRNVQIGAIKQGIRLATVARKAERVMEVAHRSTYSFETDYPASGHTAKHYKFYDSASDSFIVAGQIIKTADGDEFSMVSKYSSEEVDDITPELLHERSNRRCKRLGKAHAV